MYTHTYIRVCVQFFFSLFLDDYTTVSHCNFFNNFEVNASDLIDILVERHLLAHDWIYANVKCHLITEKTFPHSSFI